MNSNMKRIIVNFVLVILAFIVQTCIFPLLPFLAVYPNLMVILVFSGRTAAEVLAADNKIARFYFFGEIRVERLECVLFHLFQIR